MKAVVLYGPRNVAVGELPQPAVGAGDVCIRVSYCGICGSDLHKFEGKKNTHPVRYPVALGHEISGVVCAVGENVKGFREGDRVTADPNWSCGKGRYCQAGKPSFCENARGVVKGMAQFISVPEENVYHLPDGLSLRDAALTEPLACCLHGMDLLGVRQGESVALVGLGAIGLIMLQLLRKTGAGHITVVEYLEEKRALALESGADEFICSKNEEELRSYLQTPSADRVIECVGRGEAQQIALAAADKGATVVLFGVSDAAETLPVSFYDAFTKELTIKTSFVNPHTTARAVALLAAGALDTERIFSKELTMEEAAEEIRAPRHTRVGKVLVKID